MTVLLVFFYSITALTTTVIVVGTYKRLWRTKRFLMVYAVVVSLHLALLMAVVRQNAQRLRQFEDDLRKDKQSNVGVTSKRLLTFSVTIVCPFRECPCGRGG